MKKSVYVILLVLLASVIVAGCSSSENTKSADAPKQANSEPVKAPPIPQVIGSWSGNSIKTTDTFHVSSDKWKIRWDTKSGEYGDMNFIIYVYKDSGALKDVAANVIGASSDQTIMRGSGDYYLKIVTSQPYNIEVVA